MIKSILTMLLLLALPAALWSQQKSLYINEILALNETINFDPDFGQASDWVELKNSASQPLDVGGYFLSDDRALPYKWQLPPIQVDTDGYVILWADGTDAVKNGIHTPFRLSAAGEWLGLFSPQGVLLDSLSFPAQISDVSYGRHPQMPDSLGFMALPTPEQANVTPLLPGRQAAAPTVSHRSGFYKSGLQVTFTAPAGSVLRFTTDGSIPAPTSPVLQSPIVLNETTVMRARCFEAGALPSPTVTRTFLIDEPVTLPVISLVTPPQHLWNEEIGIYVDENIARRRGWERRGTLEYFENRSPAFAKNVDFRLFGRTAIHIPQKSLAFFVEPAVEYPLFPDIPTSSFSSFLLRSSSDDWDDTMFRDGLMQNILRPAFRVDTQAYRAAILFLNGRFWGIHNVREKFNEAYLSSHYNVDPNAVDLLYVNFRDNVIEVASGDDTQFRAFLEFIDTHDVRDESVFQQIETMIDLDSYIDFVVAQTVLGNVSWVHNIRVWRPQTPGARWRWMIFDLDRAMKEYHTNILADMNSRSPIFKALIRNTEFQARLLQRLYDHLSTTFQPQRVLAKIDSVRALLYDVMPRHIEKWKDECSSICGVQSMEAWEAEIANMSEFAWRRPQIVLDQYHNLIQVPNTARLSVHLQPADAGMLSVDHLPVAGNPVTQLVPQGQVVELQADPHPGYLFQHWIQETGSNSMMLVPRGDTWRYSDAPTPPASDWMTLAFDDTDWKSGCAKFGYGDGDVITELDFGGDPDNKIVTYYFRKIFHVSTIPDHALSVHVLRDDGAVIYLNGVEVLRSNMPEGTISFDTFAASSVTGSEEQTYFSYEIEPQHLKLGENVIAVELHQRSTGSSDTGFDLQLSYDRQENGQILSTSPSLDLLVDADISLTAQFQRDTTRILPAVIDEPTWLSAQQSPYFVERDVQVAPGTTLILEPGARVLFAPDRSLIVRGALDARGTIEHPVLFLSAEKDNAWGGLAFDSTSAPCTLSHVIVDGASTPGGEAWQKAAVSSYHADVTLQGVHIRNVGDPLSVRYGRVHMDSCVLDGSYANDDIVHVVAAEAIIERCQLYGDGEIDFDFVDNGILRNNVIRVVSHNTNQDAIDLGSSRNVWVEGNTIFDATDKGISIGERSSAVVRRNLVVNCETGVAVKDSSTATVINNTFFRNEFALQAYEKNAGQGGGRAESVNNIFSQSYQQDTQADELSRIAVSFCLSDQELHPGTGNLFAAPQFVDADRHKFQLRASSPARDAGDPNSPPDPDGTRADIGAFAFDNRSLFGSIVINELCASNSSLLADNAGEFDDWFELYNASDIDIDVAGLYMTDDANEPGKWRLSDHQPNESTIPSRGHVLFWADGQTEQGARHTSFRLDAAGEALYLYSIQHGDTSVVDGIEFPALGENQSYGRMTDGHEQWMVFDQPTPGDSNMGMVGTPDKPDTPQVYTLQANYPNPFNAQTFIRFSIPENAVVTLTVYDMLGRFVKTLHHKELVSGWHTVQWDARNQQHVDVGSGVYLIQMKAGTFQDIRKMLLVR